MRIRYSLTLLCSICILVNSCDFTEISNQSSIDSGIAVKNTNKVDTSVTIKQDTLPTIHYRILTLNDSVKNQIKKQFDIHKLTIIGAINRIDVDRLIRADSLIIPDTFYTDIYNYSPFPSHLEILDSISKFVLISYSIQAFSVYNSGQLIKWGPVSMGKELTPTPSGYYHTNWKSKRQISTDNPDWILPWYFNIINVTGVSFHQFELPGYPASHSCIRLREEDAEWIYNYAEQWVLDKKGWNVLVQGTPVIIFGSYNFANQAPWFELMDNSQATIFTAVYLDSLINPYLNILHTEQKARFKFFNDTL
jgi:lipoprotein-anchoring transpeptidase ErfK/SrfK